MQLRHGWSAHSGIIDLCCKVLQISQSTVPEHGSHRDNSELWQCFRQDWASGEKDLRPRWLNVSMFQNFAQLLQLSDCHSITFVLVAVNTEFSKNCHPKVFLEPYISKVTYPPTCWNMPGAADGPRNGYVKVPLLAVAEAWTFSVSLHQTTSAERFCTVSCKYWKQMCLLSVILSVCGHRSKGPCKEFYIKQPFGLLSTNRAKDRES